MTYSCLLELCMIHDETFQPQLNTSLGKFTSQSSHFFMYIFQHSGQLYTRLQQNCYFLTISKFLSLKSSTEMWTKKNKKKKKRSNDAFDELKTGLVIQKKKPNLKIHRTVIQNWTLKNMHTILNKINIFCIWVIYNENIM